MAAVAAVQARTGTSRAAFINNIMGSGKTISALSFAIPSAMARAAASGDTMNGIGKVLRSVIGVFTKPGATVWTTTPRGPRLPRSDANRLSRAAFDAPYASAPGMPR